MKTELASVSLCSGYGGLDLAVERVLGAVTVAHAEVNKAASKVLAAHWPDIPNLGDITTVDWSSIDVDIITAGYPCQPFSLSGSRKGTDDERHLWPHVAEAIRRVRPRLVVLENVPGHRSLGFDAVLRDLAAMRYVGSWRSVRASDVGAPHQRERLFIVARDADRLAWSSPSAREGRPGTVDEPGTLQRTVGSDRASAAAHADRDTVRVQPVAEPGRGEATESRDAREAAPDAYVDGFAEFGRQLAEQCDSDGRGGQDVAWGPYEHAVRRWERLTRRAPAPAHLDAEGVRRLSPRFVEWMQGLPDGWVTGVPGIDDDELLKMLGNGVVPQQAEAALSMLLVSGVSR